MSKFEDLEKKIGFSFENLSLLKEALTHRSYLNERPNWNFPHNERLEYLGDAVLELAVTEALFHQFPELPEGELTVYRAALVNYQMLSKIALSFNLDEFILMSKGEAKDVGKGREVILANAIEALIGAIYLDQGFEVTKRFVTHFVLSHLDDILKSGSYKDAKSTLQEIIQDKLKVTPTYKVIEESGPAHQKTFRVGVYFGNEFIETGTGNSKQEAELEAARQALKKYQ